MDQQTVYGLKAALALLEKRPQAVIRLLYRADRAPQLQGTFAWLAAQHLPYRELDEEGLRKVAAGPHHEGVVVVAQPLRYAALPPGTVPKGLWLALDGVDNPHNLGAILRSAAFFAVQGVIVGAVQPEDKVNAAVLRVSEGGAEHVRLFAAPDLAATLRDLAQRVPVLGLETDAKRPLERGVAAPALVLTVGNEQSGLSPAVRRVCTGLHFIPGSGLVGSLNVSVATGIALALLAPPQR